METLYENLIDQLNQPGSGLLAVPIVRNALKDDEHAQRAFVNYIIGGLLLTPTVESIEVGTHSGTAGNTNNNTTASIVKELQRKKRQRQVRCAVALRELAEEAAPTPANVGVAGSGVGESGAGFATTIDEALFTNVSNTSSVSIGFTLVQRLWCGAFDALITSTTVSNCTSNSSSLSRIGQTLLRAVSAHVDATTSPVLEETVLGILRLLAVEGQSSLEHDELIPGVSMGGIGGGSSASSNASGVFDLQRQASTTAGGKKKTLLSVVKDTGTGSNTNNKNFSFEENLTDLLSAGIRFVSSSPFTHQPRSGPGLPSPTRSSSVKSPFLPILRDTFVPLMKTIGSTTLTKRRVIIGVVKTLFFVVFPLLVDGNADDQNSDSALEDLVENVWGGMWRVLLRSVTSGADSTLVHSVHHRPSSAAVVAAASDRQKSGSSRPTSGAGVSGVSATTSANQFRLGSANPLRPTTGATNRPGSSSSSSTQQPPRPASSRGSTAGVQKATQYLSSKYAIMQSSVCRDAAAVVSVIVDSYPFIAPTDTQPLPCCDAQQTNLPELFRPSVHMDELHNALVECLDRASSFLTSKRLGGILSPDQSILKEMFSGQLSALLRLCGEFSELLSHQATKNMCENSSLPSLQGGADVCGGLFNPASNTAAYDLSLQYHSRFLLGVLFATDTPTWDTDPALQSRIHVLGLNPQVQELLKSDDNDDKTHNVPSSTLDDVSDIDAYLAEADKHDETAKNEGASSSTAPPPPAPVNAILLKEVCGILRLVGDCSKRRISLLFSTYSSQTNSSRSTAVGNDVETVSSMDVATAYKTSIVHSFSKQFVMTMPTLLLQATHWLSQLQGMLVSSSSASNDQTQQQRMLEILRATTDVAEVLSVSSWHYATTADAFIPQQQQGSSSTSSSSFLPPDALMSFFDGDIDNASALAMIDGVVGLSNELLSSLVTTTVVGGGHCESLCGAVASLIAVCSQFVDFDSTSSEEEDEEETNGEDANHTSSAQADEVDAKRIAAVLQLFVTVANVLKASPSNNRQPAASAPKQHQRTERLRRYLDPLSMIGDVAATLKDEAPSNLLSLSSGTSFQRERSSAGEGGKQGTTKITMSQSGDYGGNPAPTNNNTSAGRTSATNRSQQEQEQIGYLTESAKNVPLALFLPSDFTREELLLATAIEQFFEQQRLVISATTTTPVNGNGPPGLLNGNQDDLHDAATSFITLMYAQGHRSLGNIAAAAVVGNDTPFVDDHFLRSFVTERLVNECLVCSENGGHVLTHEKISAVAVLCRIATHHFRPQAQSSAPLSLLGSGAESTTTTSILPVSFWTEQVLPKLLSSRVFSDTPIRWTLLSRFFVDGIIPWNGLSFPQLKRHFAAFAEHVACPVTGEAACAAVCRILTAYCSIAENTASKAASSNSWATVLEQALQGSDVLNVGNANGNKANGGLPPASRFTKLHREALAEQIVGVLFPRLRCSTGSNSSTAEHHTKLLATLLRTSISLPLPVIEGLSNPNVGTSIEIVCFASLLERLSTDEEHASKHLSLLALPSEHQHRLTASIILAAAEPDAPTCLKLEACKLFKVLLEKTMTLPTLKVHTNTLIELARRFSILDLIIAISTSAAENEALGAAGAELEEFYVDQWSDTVENATDLAFAKLRLFLSLRNPSTVQVHDVINETVTAFSQGVIGNVAKSATPGDAVVAFMEGQQPSVFMPDSLWPALLEAISSGCLPACAQLHPVLKRALNTTSSAAAADDSEQGEDSAAEVPNLLEWVDQLLGKMLSALQEVAARQELEELEKDIDAVAKKDAERVEAQAVDDDDDEDGGDFLVDGLKRQTRQESEHQQNKKNLLVDCGSKLLQRSCNNIDRSNGDQQLMVGGIEVMIQLLRSIWAQRQRHLVATIEKDDEEAKAIVETFSKWLAREDTMWPVVVYRAVASDSSPFTINNVREQDQLQSLKALNKMVKCGLNEKLWM